MKTERAVSVPTPLDLLARAIDPSGFDQSPAVEQWAAGRREPAYAKARKYLVALRSAAPETRLVLAAQILPDTHAVVPRALLIEARDEITSTVKHEYAGMEGYPSQMRRMERDMDLPRRLDRAAAPAAGEGA
jgi:hypothetical protein